MKILITTGHPHSGYGAVQQILEAAGQAVALPSRRESLSVSDLHANILKASGHHSSGADARTTIEPGKVWEEVGVDLFLGNLSHQLWGWADHRSTWLLDFWKNFDKQTRFILVYSSPEAAIGRMLENHSTPVEDIQHGIASWLAYNAEILRFYHRNQDRCMLVNADAVTVAPENLIKIAGPEFGLRALPAGFSTSAGEFSAISACLAKALLEDNQDATALYLELESAAELDLSQSIGERLTKQQAWQEYVKLRSALDSSRHMQVQQDKDLAEQQTNCTLLKKEKLELEQNLAELTVAGDAQAKLASEQQEQIKQLTQTRDAQEKQFKDALQENELLLLQLHQVQEELEHYFLKHGELSKECAEQTKLASERLNALEHMTRARERQTQITEERTRQIEKLCQERDRQAKLAAEHLNALEHMTRAREQQTQITEERTRQIEKLCQERDRQARLAAERQQKIEELNKALAEQSTTVAQQEEVDQLIAYAHFWRQHQPAEVLVDMRREINGENWYPPEEDGRWAGPSDTSLIRVPSLRDGLYTLQLEIVDAMAPDIAEETMVTLNGIPLEVSVSGDSYPLLLNARFSTDVIPESLIWQFALKYPRLASPADSGFEDARTLGIRLGALKLACAD